MTGLAMMLKALGVNIEPEKIESVAAQLQTAIPEIIQFTKRLDANIRHIDTQMELMRRDFLELRESLAGRDSAPGPGSLAYPVIVVANRDVNGEVPKDGA